MNLFGLGGKNSYYNLSSIAIAPNAVLPTNFPQMARHLFLHKLAFR